MSFLQKYPQIWQSICEGKCCVPEAEAEHNDTAYYK